MENNFSLGWYPAVVVLSHQAQLGVYFKGTKNQGLDFSMRPKEDPMLVTDSQPLFEACISLCTLSPYEIIGSLAKASSRELCIPFGSSLIFMGEWLC